MAQIEQSTRFTLSLNEAERAELLVLLEHAQRERALRLAARNHLIIKTRSIVRNSSYRDSLKSFASCEDRRHFANLFGGKLR